MRSKSIGQKLPLAPAPISGTATGLCSASSVAYTVANVTHANSYSWTIPAGATIAAGAGTNSITVNFGITAGAVTVRGVNSCGNGSQRSLSVSVNPGRPASISGDVAVCINATKSYTAATAVGAVNYNWTVPSGASNITTPATAKTIQVLFGGVVASNQIITVNASNTCGTSPSRSLTGISIQSCSGSRDQMLEQGFSASVWPNPMPGTGMLQIISDTDERINLRLTDVSGRLVSERSLEVLAGTSSHEISVAGYPQGFYLLQIQSAAFSKTIRVIVE
jgi:hypothetical protein